MSKSFMTAALIAGLAFAPMALAQTTDTTTNSTTNGPTPMGGPAPQVKTGSNANGGAALGTESNGTGMSKTMTTGTVGTTGSAVPGTTGSGVSTSPTGGTGGGTVAPQ